MLKIISMNDFYKRLKRYKSFNKLSYGDLGSIINKSSDAFRQAVNRESLSELEVNKLEQYINGEAEIIEKEKPLQHEDVGVDDLIARRVAENLKPFIQEKTDELMAVIIKLRLDMQRLDVKQEKALEKITVIEERE